VAFAEVDQFIDTPVKRYSSGMYVRLAFAVAAHLEPEILLVDEVLAVGDAAFQKKCLGKMGTIAGEGRTVILVSHNMGSITSLTQEAMWLEEGRLRERGSTEVVVRNYIKRVNEQIADRSAEDLTQIKNRIGTREFGMLTAARLLTHDGKPATSFLEREPFNVELEFLLKRATKQIELGCNIRTPEGGTSLFMSPSGQYAQTFEPGTYVSRVRIDPNYLRAGSYSISLYLFVQHLKDDVVPMALGLTIEPYLEADDGAFFMKYSTGYFRFDYEWTEIQPVEKSPEPVVR
jgi:lipopolysaccharide transport system ATP-binding protein